MLKTTLRRINISFELCHVWVCRLCMKLGFHPAWHPVSCLFVPKIAVSAMVLADGRFGYGLSSVYRERAIEGTPTSKKQQQIPVWQLGPLHKHARGEHVPPSLGGVFAPRRELASNCADSATICADGRTCYGVAVLKLCARRMRSGMHKVLGSRTRALLHCWREMFDRHA